MTEFAYLTALSDEKLRDAMSQSRALKSWRALRAQESEWQRRHPQRVELAQDAYYYGTAADR